MSHAVLPLDELELRGCFAGDGIIHPEAVHGTGEVTALLRDLPAGLFADLPETTRMTVEDDDPLRTTALHSIPSTVTDEDALPESASRDPARATTERRRHTSEGDLTALPRIGAVIDKYRIEEELGAGGFATVYRATHLLMRATVALKILHPRVIALRPQLVEQLCEEARFTSLIDHPNVVRVADVTSGGRYTYIVMEWIDGVSLGRAIERQPLRPKEVLKLGMHIVAGLQAGMEQGLVHRDIKPGNILINRAGKAKIVDFGLARNLHLDADAKITSGVFDGEVAGTPAYMAPEQATNFAGADFRADIYSLGATLYHASVGMPPFTDQDPLRLVYAHIHTDPPRPQQFIPGFPERFANLLLWMLAKRPEDRPGSYAILATELRETYEQLRRNSEMRKSTELLSKVKGLFSRREAVVEVDE